MVVRKGVARALVTAIAYGRPYRSNGRRHDGLGLVGGSSLGSITPDPKPISLSR